MKIEGTPKPQGSETRRFSAAKPSAPGGKSFGDALKKAAAAPAPESPLPAQPSLDSSVQARPGLDATPAPTAAGAAAGNPGPVKSAANPASFENHMEMVKLRLKSGYYSGSNIDEALSDRLTGYFDELA